MTVIGTIQVRRGTAAEWASVNPTLLEGEKGLETDTKKTKMGDGVTAWNALAYDSALPAGGTTGQVLAKNSNADNDTEWIDAASGGGLGYVLFAGTYSFNPSASTNYYFGDGYITDNTAWSSLTLGIANGLTVPKSGAIKNISLKLNVWSTPASAENATFKILIYDNTASLVSTTTISSTVKFNVSPSVLFLNYAYSGLNIAVSAGQLIVLEIDTPSWSTSPLSVFLSSNIYIE